MIVHYHHQSRFMNIAESSPLYEYWNSEQDENDEKKRLLKLNAKEPASSLFRNEPYKWENLYQSVVRNVIKGDDSSIKGLMVLLSTINNKEKDKSLMYLEKFLDKRIIYKLRNEKYQDIKSRKNIFIALIILLNIFLNPYGVVIKKNKNHIYEETGMFFYKLRKMVFFNK
tara:strand:- start:22 stop:531 length:510 start_codon:yes stop_codon:yes gene_type:complete